MKRTLLFVLSLCLVASCTSAHAIGFRFGHSGGHGLIGQGRLVNGVRNLLQRVHDHDPNDYDPNSYDPNFCDPNSHGHGWHFHGWGRFKFGSIGWGHFDPQGRIEDKFADLMDAYDAGVQEVEDFFNSDEYQEIVDDLENLIDKDDHYLERIELRIEGVGNKIEHLEDKLSMIEEGWDPNQLGDLPDKWQDWAEHLHELKSDVLSNILERLSEKQTSLEESLDENLMLNDDLNDYLEEILGSGGAAEVVESATAMIELPLSVTHPTLGAGSVGVIPEPNTFVLAMLGCLGLRRARRRR